MKHTSAKKRRKNGSHKCIICHESDRSVLDVHRIKPGCDGGTYQLDNTVSLCSSCHRKVHSGRYVLDGWFMSTKGILLHAFIDQQEVYLPRV